MADQKEVNELERGGRLEKIVTGGLGLLTLLYLGGIVYLFGCDVWGLTQNNRMGEAGDFIAGIYHSSGLSLADLWIFPPAERARSPAQRVTADAGDVGQAG